LLSFPSKAEIDALQSKSLLVEAEVTKLRTGYVSYRHWVDQINKQNEKVLNISFLQQLPNGLYVTDMTQKRKDLSEISVKAADPALVSQSINLMSNQFKNVKLLAVEANQEDLYQLSKITYRVE
jgi:ABC-type Fe2+-enterobactin transport system substrate-binding protein